MADRGLIGRGLNLDPDTDIVTLHFSRFTCFYFVNKGKMCFKNQIFLIVQVEVEVINTIMIEPM